MYNENNNGINLKDIIIKAVFLVLFVLLIVWLFPKVPNMKAFYSNVFRENIKYMQEAAESYYTTDKLPKNVGDSVELTLKEMIDKNIIIPFVDKDGKECDGKKSFAQITKNKNDYTLTVTLVCPKEKNTLKKTLGCHNYCQDCEALENQFKRQVSSSKKVYECPNGGTVSGSKCIVTNTTSKNADSSTGASQTVCDQGGSLVNGVCLVSSNSQYNATPITTPSQTVCNTGSLVNGKCESSYNAEYVPGGTSSYPAELVVEPGGTYAATPNTTTDIVPAKKETTSYTYPATE